MSNCSLGATIAFLDKSAITVHAFMFLGKGVWMKVRK